MSKLNHFELASTLDLYLLGISIVIGGQAFSWNPGVESGFFEYLTSIIIVAIGYLCLILCLSEMISALPFSGGLYGLARVALSPYIGFLVGSCELIQNILYVGSSVIPFGWMLTEVFGTDKSIEPVWWVLFLISSCFINVSGGKIFWYFNRFAGVLCLILIILFIISALVNSTDFYSYALDNVKIENYTFKAKSLFQRMPLATWFFIGVELIPFASSESPNASKSLPVAMIGCLLTLILTAFCVYFAACSQEPGIIELSKASFPFDYGYSQMFNISKRFSTIIVIPLTYTTAFGFMFGCGRQMTSLSNSGLLPCVLSFTTKQTHSPYIALILGSFLSFIAMCIIRYCLNDKVEILFYICILGSVFVYINILITFIVFRAKYSSLKREFENPFGIYSAVLGIIIFLILAISVLGLQQDNNHIIAPISFAIYIFIGSCYYFCYANRKQYFSEDEQKAFFIAYVINANLRGRKKRRKSADGSNSDSFSENYFRIRAMVSNISNKIRRVSMGGSNRSSSLMTQTTLVTKTNSRKEPNADVIALFKSSKDPEDNIDHYANVEVFEPIQESQKGESGNSSEGISRKTSSKKPFPSQLEDLAALERRSIEFRELPSVNILYQLHNEQELSGRIGQNQDDDNHYRFSSISRVASGSVKLLNGLRKIVPGFDEPEDEFTQKVDRVVYDKILTRSQDDAKKRREKLLARNKSKQSSDYVSNISTNGEEDSKKNDQDMARNGDSKLEDLEDENYDLERGLELESYKDNDGELS